MTLLDKADVRALVPQELFSDDQLTVTMRLVAGWLREDTGLTDLPDPLPDTHALWAPALELVALVASNPTSLASKTAGPTSRTWPLARERDAIRARVRTTWARTGGAGGAAAGCFPPAQPWPDAPRLPRWSW
jgi:hypothetical protein